MIDEPQEFLLLTIGKFYFKYLIFADKLKGKMKKKKYNVFQ